MIEANHIDWNDLKFFVVVAKEKSLSKAAKLLRVSYSTVFRRINNLESVIDVKLFTRLSDGYELTDIGQQIFEQTENMALSVDDIMRKATENDQASGTINLTVPHNFGYKFLPICISEFQEKYADIVVNIIVTNSECDLLRKEVDVAIRATPSPPENLVGQLLFSLEWGVYASNTYIEQYGYPKEDSDLAQHRVISACSDLAFIPAFDWVRNHLPEKAIVARCNDLVSMSSMAEMGVGIALLPDDQAKPELNRLFKFEHGQNSDIWMLSHPDMRGCKRLKLFKDFLADRLPQMQVFREYGRY